jgi:membrane protein
MRAPFDGISFRGVYGRSWRQFGIDLWKETSEDNIFNGAAALGFYLTLAIFPALIFLLNLIPYLPIENLQGEVFRQLDQLLPAESAKMLSDTVVGIVSTKNEGLLSIGAVLTVWAASSGIYALMQQLNITYDVEEGRPFWKARLVALGLVVVFGLLTVSALTLVVAGDAFKSWLTGQVFWNGAFSVAYDIARWAIVFVALSLAFSLMFYLAPNVRQEFRFVTPGSAFAVVLLLAASLVFKAYISRFADYNATYGSIGTVIVLMIWLNIMGLVTLLGSEINALLEHYSPEGKKKGEIAPGNTPPVNPKKLEASKDLPSKTA